MKNIFLKKTKTKTKTNKNKTSNKQTYLSNTAYLQIRSDMEG